MFDQPELEALLRANLKRYPNAQLRGDAEVTELSNSGNRVRVSYLDRSEGQVHRVDADSCIHPIPVPRIGTFDLT